MTKQPRDNKGHFLPFPSLEPDGPILEKGVFNDNTNGKIEYDNESLYQMRKAGKPIDIGKFDKEGNFKPNFTFPSKDDVDFKTEFVYEDVTPDQLKQLLGGIKMSFGGTTRYKVFIKRIDE